MITRLQQDFVNAWVLAKDLDLLAAGGDADLAAICRVVKANYGYPVDSVVIGADGERLGHANANEAAGADPGRYLAFLDQALAKAGRRPTTATAAAIGTSTAMATGRRRPPELVVTPERPSTSLLDTVTAAGFGKPSMRFHAIDTRAFAAGGVIVLTCRVGSGIAVGRFELCCEEAGPQKDENGRPIGILVPVQTVDVGPDETKAIERAFAAGQRVGLMVKPGPDCADGEANAFLVDVTVRPR